MSCGTSVDRAVCHREPRREAPLEGSGAGAVDGGTERMTPARCAGEAAGRGEGLSVVSPTDGMDRFWARVSRGEGCWEWTGTFDRYGYGTFWLDGKTVRVHRLAWALTHGDVPAELLVCHRCDNRRCCRPAHLFLGTVRDNNRDCATKGRWRNQTQRLTPDDVGAIRRLIRDGARRADIAAQFHVSRDAIGDIATGRTWRGVGEIDTATDPESKNASAAGSRPMPAEAS